MNSSCLSGTTRTLLPLTDIVRISHDAPISLNFDVDSDALTEFTLVSIEAVDRERNLLLLADSIQQVRWSCASAFKLRVREFVKFDAPL